MYGSNLQLRMLKENLLDLISESGIKSYYPKAHLKITSNQLQKWLSTDSSSEHPISGGQFVYDRHRVSAGPT